MDRRNVLATVGVATGFALLAWLVPVTWQQASITHVVDGPAPVTWEGAVIGIMESGGMLALERTDGAGAFAAVLAEPLTELPGEVLSVTGVPGGRTCAYRNTVFAGACVPQLTDALIDL